MLHDSLGNKKKQQLDLAISVSEFIDRVIIECQSIKGYSSLCSELSYPMLQIQLIADKYIKENKINNETYKGVKNE